LLKAFSGLYQITDICSKNKGKSTKIVFIVPQF